MGCVGIKRPWVMIGLALTDRSAATLLNSPPAEV